MPKFFIALGLILLCAAAQARPAAMTSATAKLNALADTRITWNTAKAKTADVTCAGGADRVLFGTGGQSVWIGIVPAKGAPQLMDFPVRHGMRNGFCARPKKISLARLSCGDAKGNKLDGCRPSKSCQQVSIDDGGCDPFNFYWDSRYKTLRWWRN